MYNIAGGNHERRLFRMSSGSLRLRQVLLTAMGKMASASDVAEFGLFHLS
jgi:hypothetical protein